MRLVVLRNTSAGRGRGRERVDRLLAALESRGHRARVLDARRLDGPPPNGELDHALRSADALIVAGGDGTLHHSAAAAMRAGVPVYHFPLGTENLFARQFGMSSDPPRVLDALDRARLHDVDTADCNGTPFLLMCSVGFDSCVVERVAANRRGGITRAAYVAHALAEVLRPRFVPLTIHADGREIVRESPGVAIIANSSQYAARLDPARGACMRDGLLDLVFIPIASRVELARRLLQVALARHLHDPAVVSARCREATIAAAREVPFQLDGEHAGTLQPAEPLRLHVAPRTLRVLAG
jgi:diacylglycerol kinase (ATP)